MKTAVDALGNNQPDGTKLAGNLDSLWAAITLCKRTLFLLFNAVIKAREVEKAIEGVFVQRKKTAIDELKAEERAVIEAIDEKERCPECDGVGKDQHALVTSGKLD